MCILNLTQLVVNFFYKVKYKGLYENESKLEDRMETTCGKGSKNISNNLYIAYNICVYYLIIIYKDLSEL